MTGSVAPRGPHWPQDGQDGEGTRCGPAKRLPMVSIRVWVCTRYGDARAIDESLDRVAADGVPTLPQGQPVRQPLRLDGSLRLAPPLLACQVHRFAG